MVEQLNRFESDDLKLVQSPEGKGKDNPYYKAYKEIYETNEFKRKSLSPLAKSLFDGHPNKLNGIPFPDGGDEANAVFVKKHGPEKAIKALDGLMEHVGAPVPPGTWSPTQSRMKELQEYKDKILEEQGF